MAMASISLSCISFVSCEYNTVASSKQSAAAVAQCFSRRTLGHWFVPWGRSCSKDVVLGRSSKQGSGDVQPRMLGKQQQRWRVDAGLKETTLTEQQWGPPVTLGTAQLPQDVDLNKLESLLYQWGNSLTQNANLPLPVPLKVDRVEGGVRLGYIRVIDGKVEDLVHIDVIVTCSSDEQPKAMFRAIRNGQMKNSVPPGEPLIMQSLLAALKMSIPLARTSS